MKIGILGAGAIGTFVGAKLQLAGQQVVFVGRLGAELREHGVELTDHAGARARLEGRQLRYEEDAASLAECEVVFVTVKSMATEEAARPLAAILRGRRVVVSLQNGVSNPPRLRAVLPDHDVLAGVVPFNVARLGPGRFHNGTDGPIAIEDRHGLAGPIADALRAAGFAVETRADLAGLQWSKLLVNLNNGVNALSGLPLLRQLEVRGYRTLMADCVREGLAATKAEGICLARIGKLIPGVAPLALSLPDPVFFAVAGTMVKIDPQAKSSMLDDLERGRLTEVDYLNGEIVRLGARHGVPVPINQRVVALIRQAEAERRGSPRLTPEQIRRA